MLKGSLTGQRIIITGLKEDKFMLLENEIKKVSDAVDKAIAEGFSYVEVYNVGNSGTVRVDFVSGLITGNIDLDLIPDICQRVLFHSVKLKIAQLADFTSDDTLSTSAPVEHPGASNKELEYITANGEITKDSTGLYAVWDETYSDTVCNTRILLVAELALKAYDLMLDEPGNIDHFTVAATLKDGTIVQGQ